MSRDDTRRYIVAYDIPDDRRRTKGAKLLLRYGDRLQCSVFVIDGRPAKLERVKVSLQHVLESSEDSVLLCDLGPVRLVDASRFSYLGRARPITPPESLIL